MAAKRKARTPKATPAQQAKVELVMGEFKRGKLKSSSGGKVTSRSQAIAIALSEAGLSRPEKSNPGVKKRKKKSNPGHNPGSQFGGFNPGTWLSKPSG